MKKSTTLSSLIFLSVLALADSRNVSVCDAAFIHSSTTNPDSIVFTHTGASVGYYSWTFGDGDTSNLMDPTHVYANPGTYTVCLHVQTVPAGDTCSFCDTVVISACNATFSHYSNPNNPDSIHLLATEPGAIFYYWTFGDSTTGTGQYPWHEFPGPGTYTVCLTVHDSSGYCTWCDTVIIPGNPPCDASFVHYNIGNPDSVHFYPNTTNATSYLWYFGDSTTSTILNPWHQFPGPGTYNVCLVIHTATDSCYWCDTVVVPNSTSCIATFGFYSNPNNPDSIHFYANTNGASVYYWTFSDNASATGQYPWHEFPGPGTYTACLTAVFSGDTCTWCDTVIIAGNPPCNAEFSYYTMSNPDSIHFYPLYSGATGYTWTFGDGDTSHLQYPWHEYAAPGTYYVCLTTYYSAGSCTWCDSVTIGTPACNTHFAYYSLNNADSVHFYPTGNAATSYYWDFGDGNTSTMQYPWHEYASPGTYYVCLTATYSSYTCVWCDSVTIDTTSNCNAEFSYYFMSNPDSLHFYPLHTGATSFYWTFGDGDSSYYQYPWHLFDSAGVYNVCLTAIYSSGPCTWCDSIVVDSANAFHRLADNPLLDRFNFYPVAVFIFDTDAQTTQFNIYPNPGNGQFFVSIKGANLEDGTLSIGDMTGRIVYHQQINSQLIVINHSLKAGIYFVQLSDGQKVFTQKLVIE